ncbi:MAG: YlxR family protein [Cyanobacteria bacterium P01_C01_bin.118]
MEKNYRRCISCRRTSHRQNLIRIVRTYPSGKVQLNQGMGRSAYLCPHVDCLTYAQKKNRLGRSLKTAVPDNIYQQIQQTLKQSKV